MNSEIIIQSVFKDIEIITNRIFSIKNVYHQTTNNVLKKRLSNEYSYLFSRFLDLKEKVFLFYNENKDNLSYTSLLIEKYNRCEKLIYQNNNLFFV